MPSIFSTIFGTLFGSSGGQAGTARRTLPGLEVFDERPDGSVMFSFKNGVYGGGRQSPDGRYLVGTADGHDEGGRFRSGQVLLLDLVEGKVLFRKTLKRPQHPWVSDDGSVFVENWAGSGGRLGGEVVAFTQSGAKAWVKKYKANTYGISLSRDGGRLLISTCNSDHKPHASKTWLVESRTGQEIWVRAGFGEVRFDGSTAVIGTDGDRLSSDNQMFRLNPDGSAPEEYRLAKAELMERQNRGKPWWVISKVEEALAGDAATGALVELDEQLAALEPQDDLDLPTRARVLRYRGEIAEKSNRLRDALDFWDRAVEVDPKVGIKRRLTALKKRLDGAASTDGA